VNLEYILYTDLKLRDYLLYVHDQISSKLGPDCYRLLNGVYDDYYVGDNENTPFK
jgi:hypothetical protein